MSATVLDMLVPQGIITNVIHPGRPVWHVDQYDPIKQSKMSQNKRKHFNIVATYDVL
jgi:hypothetical protein